MISLLFLSLLMKLRKEGVNICVVCVEGRKTDIIRRNDMMGRVRKIRNVYEANRKKKEE